jgi:probable phosphoglycerate mutase
MRHAESDVNLSKTLSCRRVDPPLTDNGLRQAEQAAAWFSDKPIRHVYTSPMLRAVQTAEVVGRQFGQTGQAVEELREIDCGVLEGRSDVEAWQQFQDLIVRWFAGDVDAGFEGGETGRDAMERMARFMRGLPDEGDVLAVGHGGIFAWGLLRLCRDLKPASGRDLYLPNTGIVLVDRTPQGFSCLKWGLADHLDRPTAVDVPEEMMG